jgi:quercetin dioxygenase-like cupin family protein
MALSIRRVVTGHDNDGHAVVQDDRVLPVSSRVGVWFTGPGPARNDGDAPITTHPAKLEPPSGGTTLRIVELAPLSSLPKESEEAKQRRAHEKFVEFEALHTLIPGRAGLHRSKTLDYIIVLDGELTCVLDDGDVTLHTGDILIQRGTAHTWENRGNHPVKYVVMMVDAQELDLRSVGNHGERGQR